MSKSRWKYIVLLIASGLFFLASLICKFFYDKPYDRYVPIKAIQTSYNYKYQRAEEVINWISSVLESGDYDSLTLVNFDTDPGICYYIYKNDSLRYWSDNTYDVPRVLPCDHTLEERLNNFHTSNYAVNFGKQMGCYKIFASIWVKSKLKIVDKENAYQCVGLGLPLDIELVRADSINNYKLKDYTQKKIVKTFKGDKPLYYIIVNNASNNNNSPLGFILWILVLGTIILFLCSYPYYHNVFPKKSHTFLNYCIVTLCYWFVIICYCRFAYNIILFRNSLFSPFFYGSTLFSSLGVLLIYTTFLCLTIYIYVVRILPHINNRIKSKIAYIIIIEVTSYISIGFILYLLHDLIFNSIIQIKLQDLQSINLHMIIALLIMIAWITCFALFRNGLTQYFSKVFSIKWLILSDTVMMLVGIIISLACHLGFYIYIIILLSLFFILLDYRCLNKKLEHNSLYTVFLIFLLHNVLVIYLIKEGDMKRYEQLQMVSQKVANGDRMGFDLLAEESLKEIDNNIQKDTFLLNYMNQYPDVDRVFITKYMRQKHFVDVWETYGLAVDVLPYSRLKEIYLNDSIEPIPTIYSDNLHFYKKKKPIGSSYLGAYKMVNNQNDTIGLFIYLTIKNNMTNDDLGVYYNSKSLSTINNTSYALYKKEKLIFQNGYFPYKPEKSHYVNNWSTKFYQMYDDGYLHNIWLIDPDTRVVITEESFSDWKVYMFYTTYVFSSVIILLYLLNLLLQGTYFSRMPNNSIVYRMQRFFIVFQMFTILAIVIISVTFVSDNHYRNERDNIKELTHQIKGYVEEKYPDSNPDSLDEAYILKLIFIVNERYKVGIHFYDKNGFLLTSTHPYLFAKGIHSQYINQEFVRNNVNENVIEETIGSFKYLSGYATINNKQGELIGYICVPYYHSMGKIEQENLKFSSAYINIYLIIILLSALLFNIYNKWISAPLIEIRHKLKAVQLGGKNEHINYPSRQKDEIGQLIKQYNTLIDELDESAKKLAETEKEMAWREMAKQVAHEIKNPLTPMKLSIQQLRRMKNNEHFYEYFDTSTDMLIEQIDSLSYIAKTFSVFAKMAPTKLVPVNIIDRLVTVLHLYKNSSKDIEINYNSTILHTVILGDSEQLIQVFNNLLKNSIQAIPKDKHGIITVNVENDENNIYISISDNGCGMNKETQDTIFELNFTTKSMGMGIGLYLVYNYVKAMSGEISVRSQEGVGSTFFLKFPRMK